MRESVGTRVIGMRSHISCMTCNIPYRTAFSVWNVIDLCMSLHVHFSWGVALIGKFLYWAFSPRRGKIFSGARGTPGGEHISGFVVKKARLWHVHIFCNILDRISSFVHVINKFCNKNLVLDRFSLV